MRSRVFVLAALFATGAGASAQTTPAGKSAAPTAPPAAASAASAARLDGYLLRWEQKMREVKTLSAVIARIDKDKTFGATRKHAGFAQYMKSGSGSTALNQAL